MKFTTDQTDMIVKISIVLKKIPYLYGDNMAEWYISILKDECVGIDFEKKEIYFVNWRYEDDEIYLQLLGICHMFNLTSEEYQRK